MNSLTHSCMHSFASLAILALSGRAVFMIRATGAKFRMLASDIAEGGDDEDEDARPPWWRRNDGEDCDDGRSKDMLEGNVWVSTKSSEWSRYRTSQRKTELRCKSWPEQTSCDERMRRCWLMSRCSVAHSDSYRGAKAAFQVHAKTHDCNARVEQIKLPTALGEHCEEGGRDERQHQPFAMGSHRSCSLTSNSPRPVPCAPSCSRSI